jgi:phage terminase large subunit GpA-like protein
MNGIWYEIVAWASNRENWTVDAGYIAGATDDPHSGAFVKLEEIRQSQWPDAFGGSRTVDSFGVDSGYRSHVVYTWVRGKAATFALDGRDGWSKPAIGAPSPVDINFNGQRIRRGAMVWGVGTWPLKGVIYADLRKEGVAAGKEVDPAGYCHFGDWLDEVYFRQITSEYLTNENYRGRIRRIWKVRNGEENHLFDCRVYNYALADYLGVSRMTADQWAVLASRRGVPAEIANPDMFAPEPVKVASAAPVAPKPAPDRTATRPVIEDDGDAWISNATGWWDD